jgi:hypothetical protein
MKNINELYHDLAEHRYYDYPVAGARHLMYRVNNGKPFAVYHKDGTSSLAYGFGEKHFTYSWTELQDAKTEYQNKRAQLNERNKLLKQLEDVDLETLRALVAMVKK